jgi:cell division protein FtsB
MALFAYFLYISIGQHGNLRAIMQETENAKVRLEQAQQVNQHLVEERDKLNTSDYVEKLAREELGLVKPGEVPYIPAQKN